MNRRGVAHPTEDAKRLQWNKSRTLHELQYTLPTAYAAVVFVGSFFIQAEQPDYSNDKVQMRFQNVTHEGRVLESLTKGGGGYCIAKDVG